jgi:uncharacterized membrane protein SirB2
MAESAIISWTPANWITIILMVVIAYAVVGFLAKAWQQNQSKMAAAA